MTTFKTNTTYFTRFIGDSDSKIFIKVLKRTPKSIRVKIEGITEIKTLRISTFDDCEMVRPMGKYSMCPIINADNEV